MLIVFCFSLYLTRGRRVYLLLMNSHTNMQNMLIKTCLFYKATATGIQFLIQLDRTHLLEMKEFFREIFSVYFKSRSPPRITFFSEKFRDNYEEAKICLLFICPSVSSASLTVLQL